MDPLSIATNGLLGAQRDAFDAANRLVEGTAQAANSVGGAADAARTLATPPADAAGAADQAAQGLAGQALEGGDTDGGDTGGDRGFQALLAPGQDSVIRSTVDLIRAENSFGAAATAFRAASDLQRETVDLLSSPQADEDA